MTMKTNRNETTTVRVSFSRISVADSLIFGDLRTEDIAAARLQELEAE